MYTSELNYLAQRVFDKTMDDNSKRCFELHKYFTNTNTTMEFVSMFALASEESTALAVTYAKNTFKQGLIDFETAKGLFHTIRYYITTNKYEAWEPVYRALTHDTDEYNVFIAHASVIGRALMPNIKHSKSNSVELPKSKAFDAYVFQSDNKGRSGSLEARHFETGSFKDTGLIISHTSKAQAHGHFEVKLVARLLLDERNNVYALLQPGSVIKFWYRRKENLQRDLVYSGCVELTPYDRKRFDESGCDYIKKPVTLQKPILVKGLHSDMGILTSVTTNNDSWNVIDYDDKLIYKCRVALTKNPIGFYMKSGKINRLDYFTTLISYK